MDESRTRASPRLSDPIDLAVREPDALRRVLGTVVAILDDEVVVDIDGVLRRVATHLVPSLRVGERVAVAVGRATPIAARAR